VGSVLLWAFTPSAAFNVHNLNLMTSPLSSSDHFEKHRSPLHGGRHFRPAGALRQPVSGKHPPHQGQADGPEPGLCLRAAVVTAGTGSLFLPPIVWTVSYIGRVYLFLIAPCICNVFQEASQLLTILQGLQPPLKLDDKTIGVDYAKSARK